MFDGQDPHAAEALKHRTRPDNDNHKQRRRENADKHFPGIAPPPPHHDTGYPKHHHRQRKRVREQNPRDSAADTFMQSQQRGHQALFAVAHLNRRVAGNVFGRPLDARVAAVEDPASGLFHALSAEFGGAAGLAAECVDGNVPIVAQPVAERVRRGARGIGNFEFGLRQFRRFALRQFHRVSMVLHETGGAEKDRGDGAPRADPQVQLAHDAMRTASRDVVRRCIFHFYTSVHWRNRL
ncbi:MAG TPA: hypothetical protein VHW73_13075 [Rudaea sp.]|nr:hypothetical protein [Rudaea sp.]